MPRIRKKTSKRGTTHQRTKVRQKVAETHKKRKRDAKRNPQWKSKHKKDPGIPSTLPFKEDILAEIEQGRRQAEEDRQRRKEIKSQTPTSSDVPSLTAVPTPSTATIDDLDAPPILIDSSLPTLGAVIESADTVLYVIDARDPQTFRSKRLEEILAQKDKSLVLALTKTDLVPKEILVGWLTYLRSETPAPVVPFRASDALIPSMEKGKQKTSFDSVSKDELLDVITEVTKSHAETTTRVAVIGLTNSGKSTLLNSLLSTPALPVYQPSLQQPKKATYANTTIGAQPISLSHGGREFYFIDTPGMGYVQFNAQPKQGRRKLDADEVEASKAKDLLIRNRGSFVHWKETDAAAAYVVSRAKHEDLMLHYNLPAYTPGDVTAFLGGVARASGRLRKGGVPDLSDTARSIARDWSLSRLPFFAVPPPPSSSTGHTSSVQSEPAVEACLSLKEMRAPPRAWPVQLDAGSPDERDVALDAVFAVEREERPVRVERMDVDEVEGEGDSEDEDEEMDSAESGSDEDDSEEDGEESESEPAPAPVSALKTKRPPTTATRPPKKVSFAASKAKPTPKPVAPPRRIGNAKPGGKNTPVVTSVAGEESYDFSKFF
ncbi:hypothetical protein FRC12_016704 [Ceratobasidium sp. 428]|nr:hypothetical protein FRC12_016704 [Ceratobasidium sp. 428]